MRTHKCISKLWSCIICIPFCDPEVFKSKTFSFSISVPSAWFPEWPLDGLYWASHPSSFLAPLNSPVPEALRPVPIMQLTWFCPLHCHLLPATQMALKLLQPTFQAQGSHIALSFFMSRYLLSFRIAISSFFLLPMHLLGHTCDSEDILISLCQSEHQNFDYFQHSLHQWHHHVHLHLCKTRVRLPVVYEGPFL